MIKIDDRQFQKVINRLVDENPREMKIAMIRGMRFFEAKIIKEQMSGRKQARLGLNRQTGTLARNWFTRIRDAGDDFKVSLGTSTIYARIHQFGGEIRPKRAKWLHFKTKSGAWVRTKKVTIPKRLRIIEDFEKSGVEIISNQLRKAILKAIKG